MRDRYTRRAAKRDDEDGNGYGNEYEPVAECRIWNGDGNGIPDVLAWTNGADGRTHVPTSTTSPEESGEL